MRFCLVAFLELRAGLIKRVQPFCFGVMGRFHFSRFGGYVVILVLAGLFDFGSGFFVFIGGTFCLGWFVYF